MRESVTRIRPGAQTGTDAFNDPIYGPDVEATIDGALFSPGGSTEAPEPGRDPIVTVPTLYFRGSWPDITATDRVRVRGQVFEVVGVPANWQPAATGVLC